MKITSLPFTLVLGAATVAIVAIREGLPVEKLSNSWVLGKCSLIVGDLG